VAEALLAAGFAEARIEKSDKGFCVLAEKPR